MCKQTIKKDDKYNNLTAIKFYRRTLQYRLYWLFKCDCGKEKVILVDNVKSGKSKSCGCLWKEKIKGNNTTHGMAGTKTYCSWANMKYRCLNKNRKRYKDYGGRGIIICDRWLNGFTNFYADMGECPQNKTLDRKDNNGNYKPNNCRWATSKQQHNNKRTNHLITYKNKTQNVTQWAEKIGIDRGVIYERLKRGWSIERALTKII